MTIPLPAAIATLLEKVVVDHEKDCVAGSALQRSLVAWRATE
jgi:hypothetical protein